ncbi:MAG: hormogonium polysaccharide biosynthesis glycosyltransferase HpsP [Cyanobacteria bacterium]|nr:hormogonium polysaccharide biosynthesis glycosyltransferase HpsP [Cyanobacteriota bacterium]MDA0866512.1 hormogonium polysaccharide biosynthesis glycosyltransferase HpsP [Cyanobacteriota bacterium]
MGELGRPLRVLQIVPSVSLVYGGPSQMIRGFSKALAEAGAEVTLVTTDSNGDVDEAPLDVPLNQPVPESGYTTWYFRCSPFRRYKFSLGLLRWLMTHAQDYDIAHIHALFSPVSSTAATVARWRGLPYLLRPLGTLDPADLRKKYRLKQLYAAVLERSNLAGAAAIHFTSAQEALISERFNTQTPDLVLPLGVTPLPHRWGEVINVRDKYGIPADCPIVLFMSRIDPKKGLDLLLPALEALQQQGLPFHFVLCGANPQDRAYEQSISQRIADSPLQAQTTVTGYVAGDLKTALLEAANLFVLPSYYENFGIAVAEAMLTGVPVVISDQVHIWQDIQRSQSGWVCQCTEASVTERLREALMAGAEQQQRGDNAVAFAKANYSWPAIARQAIAAYGKLLA